VLDGLVDVDELVEADGVAVVGDEVGVAVDVAVAVGELVGDGAGDADDDVDGVDEVVVGPGLAGALE
jgi:hypothetical protein